MIERDAEVSISHVASPRLYHERLLGVQANTREYCIVYSELSLRIIFSALNVSYRKLHEIQSGINIYSSLFLLFVQFVERTDMSIAKMEKILKIQ